MLLSSQHAQKLDADEKEKPDEYWADVRRFSARQMLGRHSLSQSEVDEESEEEAEGEENGEVEEEGEEKNDSLAYNFSSLKASSPARAASAASASATATIAATATPAGDEETCRVCIPFLPCAHYSAYTYMLTSYTMSVCNQHASFIQLQALMVSYRVHASNSPTAHYLCHATLVTTPLSPVLRRRVMLHHPAHTLPGAVLTPYLARYTLVLLSSTMTASTRSSRPSCT